jgi:hypothetical protein
LRNSGAALIPRKLRGILIPQRPELSHWRSAVLAGFAGLFNTTSKITSHGHDQLSAIRINRD